METNTTPPTDEAEAQTQQQTLREIIKKLGPYIKFFALAIILGASPITPKGCDEADNSSTFTTSNPEHSTNKCTYSNGDPLEGIYLEGCINAIEAEALHAMQATRSAQDQSAEDLRWFP
jgi:hypothetical protein